MRSLLIVLAAGLLIRLVCSLANQRLPVSDEHEYDQLAMSIAAHGSYAIDGVSTAYRPVGYPAFLATTYWLSGHNLLFAKIVQAILDTLTAYLLFVIGEIRSRPVGLVAATFWSFFPPAILYANLLLSESLAVFLIVLSLLVFLKAVGPAHLRLLVMFAGLTGAAILVKPELLLFPILLLLLSRQLAIRLRHTVAAFAVTLAVLLPWTIRNLVVLDTFSLSTNAGMNLYIGNNPEASGAYRGTFPEELADTSLDEIVRDRKAMEIAKDYIVAHPSAFVFNGIKKLAHVFRSEGDVLIASFSDDSSYYHAGFVERYRSVPLPFAVVTNMAFFVLLLGGIMGFVVSEHNRLFWFAVSFLGAILAAHFIFFGGSRFHFVLMPFAAIYASEALIAFKKKTLTLTGTRKRFLLICIVLLLAIWSYELSIVYRAS